MWLTVTSIQGAIKRYRDCFCCKQKKHCTVMLQCSWFRGISHAHLRLRFPAHLFFSTGTCTSAISWLTSSTVSESARISISRVTQTSCHHRIITGDETSVCGYCPQAKLQSLQWKFSFLWHLKDCAQWFFSRVRVLMLSTTFFFLRGKTFANDPAEGVSSMVK